VTKTKEIAFLHYLKMIFLLFLVFVLGFFQSSIGIIARISDKINPH